MAQSGAIFRRVLGRLTFVDVRGVSLLAGLGALLLLARCGGLLSGILLLSGSLGCWCLGGRLLLGGTLWRHDFDFGGF
jgi:hypothetical protein